MRNLAGYIFFILQLCPIYSRLVIVFNSAQNLSYHRSFILNLSEIMYFSSIVCLL